MPHKSSEPLATQTEIENLYSSIKQLQLAQDDRTHRSDQQSYRLQQELDAIAASVSANI